MKPSTKTVRCRQCIVKGCGVIFTSQQAQSLHCRKKHKRKSKENVTWKYVQVQTTIL
jgi:hypothetical protein